MKYEKLSMRYDLTGTSFLWFHVVGRKFYVIHILFALYSLQGWWCNAVNHDNL